MKKNVHGRTVKTSEINFFFFFFPSPGLQKGGKSDEPRADQEVNGAQPIRGGADQDQRHSGRTVDGS